MPRREMFVIDFILQYTTMTRCVWGLLVSEVKIRWLLQAPWSNWEVLILGHLYIVLWLLERLIPLKKKCWTFTNLEMRVLNRMSSTELHNYPSNSGYFLFQSTVVSLLLKTCKFCLSISWSYLYNNRTLLGFLGSTAFKNQFDRI